MEKAGKQHEIRSLIRVGPGIVEPDERIVLVRLFISQVFVDPQPAGHEYRTAAGASDFS